MTGHARLLDQGNLPSLPGGWRHCGVHRESSFWMSLRSFEASLELRLRGLAGRYAA